MPCKCWLMTNYNFVVSGYVMHSHTKIRHWLKASNSLLAANSISSNLSMCWISSGHGISGAIVPIFLLRGSVFRCAAFSRPVVTIITVARDLTFADGHLNSKFPSFTSLYFLLFYSSALLSRKKILFYPYRSSRERERENEK